MSEVTGRQAGDRLVAGRGAEDRFEAELAGLGDPAVGVGDVADLAGEAELAEAGERLAVRTPGRGPSGRTRPPGRSRGRRPGSSTRMPPATLTKTSAAERETPPWRVSTARTRASRLRSTPVAVRRGGTISVGATSACTSTSSGRVPSIAQSTTDPGAGWASPTKRAEGSTTSTRPPCAHLEDADLAGGAEAVLEGAHRPEGPLPLALEVQHAVDQVLEGPRARRASPPWSRARSGSGSRRAAWRSRAAPRSPRARRRRCPARHRGRRASAPSRSRRPPAARPRSPPARSRATARRASARTARPRRGARPAAAPGRPTPRRRRRACPSPGRARLASAIPASVLLPIPGAPPSRTRDPGTKPPPSTRSSSRDAGGEPLGALGLDVAQRHRLRRSRAPGRRHRVDPGGGAAPLLERVPGTAARALAGPGERGVTALGAPIGGRFRSHLPRLGTGADASTRRSLRNWRYFVTLIRNPAAADAH